MFVYRADLVESAHLPAPELIEIRRRSVVMLTTGAPALNREQADEVLGQLVAALLEVRRLRAAEHVPVRWPGPAVVRCPWCRP